MMTSPELATQRQAMTRRCDVAQIDALVSSIPLQSLPLTFCPIAPLHRRRAPSSSSISHSGACSRSSPPLSPFLSASIFVAFLLQVPRRSGEALCPCRGAEEGNTTREERLFFQLFSFLPPPSLSQIRLPRPPGLYRCSRGGDGGPRTPRTRRLLHRFSVSFPMGRCDHCAEMTFLPPRRGF